MKADRELIKSVIDEHPGISVSVEEIEELLVTCETITCKVKVGQQLNAEEIVLLRKLNEITMEELGGFCNE